MVKIIVAIVAIVLSASVYVINMIQSQMEQEAAEIAQMEVKTENQVGNINAEISLKDLKTKNQKNLNLPQNEVEEESKTKQLIDMQLEMEKIKNKIAATEDDLSTIQNEIDIYGNEIIEKEIEKTEKKDRLTEYLKTFYLVNNNWNLYFNFFASDNPYEFMYGYNTMQEILSRLKKDLNSTVVDTDELSLNKSKVEEKRTLYQSVLEDLKKEQEELAKKEEETRMYILQNSDVLHREMLSASSRIGGHIRTSGYTYNSVVSRFIMPVIGGEITSNYGDRIHPITGIKTHHAGLDIGVDEGTPVMASADGIIMMAGWYGGYGKVVMIKHGESFTTVYGHNSKILVNEGDMVKQGDIIALAGSTGNSTGPHCHFEIRVNGIDVNPYNFL